MSRRDLVDVYVRHYLGQRGGALAAFHWARNQNGEGLGDILRAIGRWFQPALREIAPIAKSGLSSFIKSTSTAMDEGKSLQEAAKGALAPTMSNVLSSAGERVMSRLKGDQTGSGRKRRRHSKRKATRKVKGAQSGSGRRRRVYKGKRVAKKARSKKIRFLNANF